MIFLKKIIPNFQEFILVIFLFYIYFQNIWIFLLLIIVILINLSLNKRKKFILYLFGFIFYVNLFNLIFLNSYNNIEYAVVKHDLEINEEYIKFIAKSDLQKYSFIYFFNEPLNVNEQNTLKERINYGTVIQLNSYEIDEIENMYNNRYSFNYENYMLSQRINKQFVIGDSDVVGHKNNFIYMLKNYRDKLVNKINEVYPSNSIYINSLVLGEKLEDEEVKDQIINLGIIQLFTISGMHINFIIGILKRIAKFIKIKDDHIRIILFFILPVYTVFANFGMSVVRAVEMFLFTELFKRDNISSFDIWYFVFLLNVFLNPYNILNIGFILSYFITLFLILNNEVFQSNKTKAVLKNFLITFFIFPLTVNISNYINIFIVYFLKYYEKLIQLLIILSFLAIFFLNIEFINEYINFTYSIIIFIFKLVAVINGVFVIPFPSLNYIQFIIYYYFYIVLIKDVYYFKNICKRSVISLIILLFVFNTNVNLLGSVNVVDVGQGDLILITYPLGGKKIMIDTGSEKSQEELISYFEANKIKNLDYLIISHSHEDHMGNIDDILLNVKVENLIVGKSFEDTDKYQDYTNVIVVENTMHFEDGFIYVPTSTFANENNNSLICYLDLGLKNFLFLGDAEIEEEHEFLKYFNKQVDYLKIGHHGSKTSTSQELLDNLEPKEVFISSGKDNVYNHPSDETISRLEDNNINYYNTQEDGEIVKYFI